MSSPAVSALAERVRAALQEVIDPEIGYNIVDLGLVYTIEIDEDTASGISPWVRVTMTTTTKGCPATEYLQKGVARALQQLAGIPAPLVVLTYDPPWTPKLISDEARGHLGIGPARMQA